MGGGVIVGEDGPTVTSLSSARPSLTRSLFALLRLTFHTQHSGTQSLATYDRRSGAISSVLENRVSPFIVHLLVGLSVIFLRPALAMIPTPVLYGRTSPPCGVLCMAWRVGAGGRASERRRTVYVIVFGSV